MENIININEDTKSYTIDDDSVKPNNIEKKSDKIYVKSNKKNKHKIELRNLHVIKMIEESGELDTWTLNKLNAIKNLTFKNNIFDLEEKKIVSSVRLVKTGKLGKNIIPLVWEYYRNRGNLDINSVIKQYSRNNLIINYSVESKVKSNINL